MSRDTTPKLPPETFDAIIDRVHALNDGDEKVEKLLGVCSLVCKSWFPRSRYHLFQRVVIEINAEGKPFLDLLDSPLCTFKPYVRILEVDEVCDAVEDTLPNLSAVRELAIVDSTNLVKIVSNFQNLQRFVLDGCYFHSLAQLLETLSMCTLLKSVSFYNLAADSSSAVKSLPPSSLTSVQIYTGMGNLSDVMEWLVSGEQVPAIENLDISHIHKDELWAIGHCLRRLGPSLKSLGVGFKSGIFHTDYENAFINLSYNTNLNSIIFRSDHVRIPFLLAQVTSSEVLEVVVDVSWVTMEMLGQVDWDTVARILGQPNFSKLEKLIISAHKPVGDADQVRHWMIQRLPPGRARDLIVSHNGPAHCR